ncbi:Protein RecA [Bythopirellula polymerisocia]|uniref:Protein RecA n=2 Tax=Bythopirellula polymerisocia TaxID=2528003 RepID=A0A5C6CCI4_9BACT|nr:Protein RecA [Bythopirellula polymerisocia]
MGAPICHSVRREPTAFSRNPQGSAFPPLRLPVPTENAIKPAKKTPLEPTSEHRYTIRAYSSYRAARRLAFPPFLMDKGTPVMVTAVASKNSAPKINTSKNNTASRTTMAKKEKSKSTKKTAPSAVTKIFSNSPELRNTVEAIEKQFGEGSIMPLGADHICRIEGISTGSLSADIALGGQGIPRGRIIEVYGPESSGKTTLALHVIAEAQKAGGIAAFIDAEHALDPSWAKKLGVDLETLLVSQPGHGEEAMHITEMLIKSNAVDVIVVDSVAALVPKKELDGEIGDSHVGLQARLMSQSMRKLTGAIAKSKTSVIFINQIREKIGVMFGSPETTPGGRALKFYSSCRIDVRRIGQLKDGEEVVGQRVRFKVVKNKVAPPFRTAEFDMMHKDGISYEGDILDFGVEQKILSRTGAWFRYGEMQLGQGKEKARVFLKENPEITEEVKQKILAAGGFDDLLTSKTGTAAETDESPEEDFE